MSSIPASAITSASPSFWHVMPRAPSASCRRAISTDLCVLTCGRFASPTASQCACQRARLSLEPIDVDDDGRRVDLDHEVAPESRATASISTRIPPGSPACTVVRAG